MPTRYKQGTSNSRGGKGIRRRRMLTRTDEGEEEKIIRKTTTRRGSRNNEKILLGEITRAESESQRGPLIL